MPSPLRFPLRAAIVALISSAMPLVGCGSDTDGTSGTAAADASDGRYHPAGNGKAMTEQDACAALSNARQARGKDLACSATVRPCPTFLRAQFPGNDCAQYDEGTVTGCVAYYAGKSSCEALAAAVSDCAVSPIAGTHSDGCQ